MSAAKANTSILPVDDKRRANESTMEEILASIRRIISDGQNAFGDQFRAEPEETFDPEPATDTLHGLSCKPSASLDAVGRRELDRSSSAEDRQDNILRRLKASSEAQSRGAYRRAAEILEVAERELDRVDQPSDDTPTASGAHPSAPATEQPSPLVSATAAATITAQFESLTASRLFGGEDGRMDDMVKQLLRPMLQEWLEDNLPGIVEKLVRAEIERVARGGRS